MKTTVKKVVSTIVIGTVVSIGSFILGLGCGTLKERKKGILSKKIKDLPVDQRREVLGILLSIKLSGDEDLFNDDEKTSIVCEYFSEKEIETIQRDSNVNPAE